MLILLKLVFKGLQFLIRQSIWVLSFGANEVILLLGQRLVNHGLDESLAANCDCWILDLGQRQA